MPEFKPLSSLEIYLQALVKAKLWIKVVVALVLGTAAGVVFSPETGLIPSNISTPLGSWLGLPGKLFLKLVQMIMIPMIFASIISGIVSASGEQLKKLGVRLGLYFVGTTTLSIAIGVIIAMMIQPGKLLDYSDQLIVTDQAQNSGFGLKDLPNAISDLLPENPLASMVSGEMLAIVVFTIIIGIAIVQLPDQQKRPVLKLLSAIQEICMTIVKWAMKMVPYAVFGLMAQLVMSIGINSVKGISLYMVSVLIGLALLLITYLMIITLVGRKNPFHFLSSIKDVLLLAFSTTSSAAVMPLSIKTAQEKLGISKSISNFLIPVGATINMDGTAIYQCISTLFIAQAYGLEMGLSSILIIMLTIVSASIGTPAIPGGGVVILASVLQSSGIPTEGVIIIIGAERILGMFRTAINVTGDLTACIVFDRWQLKWNPQG